MVAEEDKGITFRRLSNITQDEQISEVFSDTPNAGNNVSSAGAGPGVNVKGSPDITHALQSYTVPHPPPYGGGVLDNIEIFLYGTGITQGKSSDPPKIVAYKVDDPSSLAQTISTSVAFATGDLAVVTKEIVVGTSHIQDHFSSIYCDYFTGNNEGWATDELTITNQRISKFKGDGGLYLTPEDAYLIAYKSKPYSYPATRGFNAHSGPGVTYRSQSKSSIKKMRMKHGTGWPGFPTPYTDVDAEGNMKRNGGRLIKLKNDAADQWYTSAVNLPGGLSSPVFFKEEDIKNKLVNITPTVLTDDKIYGDEVNTTNSFFSQVRGCGEFFSASAPVEGEDGELKHQVEKVGAVKFISENVVTKGKCAQLYTFEDTSLETHPNEPERLFASQVRGIVDAVAVVGPLPMPCGPIPGPPGAFDSEWGHPATNEDDYNFGMYAVGQIEVTFTIPNMSKCATYTHDGSTYMDLFRRGVVILFSNKRPDVSSQRCADFWEQSHADKPMAGVIIVRDPPDGNKEGIWVYDIARCGNDGVGPTDHYAKTKSWGGLATGSVLSDIDATQMGPLSEGETYTITFSLPTAHYTDNMFATIRTQPVTGAPRGTLVGDEDKDTWHLALQRIDGADAGTNNFSVVNRNTGVISGDDFDTDGEVYRFMSIWNNNTKNQKGNTDWVNHAHSDVTAVDTALGTGDEDGENVEIKFNIDNIKIGNFNVPMTNNTMITAGKTGLVSMETSGADIVIAGELTRRMGVHLATSTFHNMELSSTQADHGAFTFTSSGAMEHGVSTTEFDKTNGAVPGYTMIHFGTNTATDFFGSVRYLMFNDFNCSNLGANQTGMVKSNNFYLGGGFYSGDLATTAVNDLEYALGFNGALNSCGNKASYYDTAMDTGIGGSGNNTHDHSLTLASSTSITNSTNYAGGGLIYLDGFDGGLGNVKGFRQKGLVKLDLPAVGTLTPIAGKRENFFMSAKIVAYNSVSGVATVDTVEPFKVNDDQDFIVYVMGGAHDEDKMYNKSVRCVEIIDQNHVILNWNGYATDGETKLADSDIMPGLWISPYMYWITMRICNWSGFEIGAFTENYDAASDYDVYSATHLPQKTYGSVLVASDLGTAGATYNESSYASESTTVIGAYENSWDLQPNIDSSVFQLADYGFGSFIEADEDSNQGYTGGYALEGSPVSDGWFVLKSKKGLFTKNSELRPGDSIQFLLSSKDVGTDHQMSFVGFTATAAVSAGDGLTGGDEGYVRPKLVANYFDQLPLPLINFRVEPDKSGLFPELKWDPSEDSDLWFIQVHVDDESIQHQYHKAVLHLPLNEKSTAGLFKTNLNNYGLLPKYYNYGESNVRAGALLKVSVTAANALAGAWIHNYNVALNMAYKWDGLAGNRITDYYSRRREWDDSAGIYDKLKDRKNFNSGACLHMTLTTPILKALDTASADGTIDTYYHNSTSESAETDPPSTLWTTAGTKGSWSVAESDIPVDEFTVSFIVTPTAYCYPEYTLKTAANENIAVSIVNNLNYTLRELGDAALYTDHAEGHILMNDIADNESDNAATAPSGFSGDSDDGVEWYLSNTLCKITSNSTNGGLTNSEYIILMSDEDTKDKDLFHGIYNSGWDNHAQIGLYGTGSSAGGGGDIGVPTDGGSVTVIPRSILFRMGMDSNFYPGNSASAELGKRGNMWLGADKEKFLCYMDSNGLVNVWAKPKNQNLWLKIQSSRALPQDGVTPTHVSVTFDKNLPRANLKLYINGKLDVYTGDRAVVGTETQLQDDADGQGGEPLDLTTKTDATNDEFILDIMGRLAHHSWNFSNTPEHGYGESAFDGFFGRMEEFVWLPYAVYYVNPQDESLIIDKPFTDLRDTDYAQPKAHFAKMFIKDYHNIRGTSADEVRQTNNVSWRKTAFKLNMS